MHVATKQLVFVFSLIALWGSAQAQMTPRAPDRPVVSSAGAAAGQGQMPQAQIQMSPKETQERSAVAGRELLLAMSGRVNEGNRRLEVMEGRLSNQLGKTTWLLLGGVSLMVLFAAFASFAGFQYAKHQVIRKERELIEAGMEPLSVLIHSTRDQVTRLAQRLRMAGATDTRLYEGLLGALPPLQVEAGKATFNLSRQIPKSEQPYLEGPVVPLDRIQRAERATPRVVSSIVKPPLSAADVGVANIVKNRAMN